MFGACMLRAVLNPNVRRDLGAEWFYSVEVEIYIMAQVRFWVGLPFAVARHN